MRLLAILAATTALAAEPWPLERLFTRPFAWGTSPERVAWSKQGHTLAFLWNASGRRFLDLYAYHPDSRKLVRLTDLEGIDDEINRGDAEKDPIQKNYLMPKVGLSDFDLSADGRRAAFSYQGDLYLVATDGATPPLRLTKTRAAETNPRISPDLNQLAFRRDGQVFVLDFARSSLIQVTAFEASEGTLVSYAWSPYGRRMRYSLRAGRSRTMPLPNYSGRLVRAPEFPRTVAGDDPLEIRHFVIPTAGGKPVPLEPGDWGGKVWGAPPDWSDDSRLLIRSVIHPKHKMRRILVFDAATGKAAKVFEENDPQWVTASFAGFSPDSRHVFFLSERDGWMHLYRVPVEGGEPTQLTLGHWEINPGERLSLEPQWIGDFIYYGSTEGGASERHFHRIRADGSDKVRLSSKPGINVGAVSADGKHIAWLLADLSSPFDLYVDDHRLTTSPLPAFREYPWPETRLVSFPSRHDGKTVQAKILLPPGYRLDDRGQKPRPAVLFIHGAGYATSVLRQWGSYHEHRFVFNCHLANQGYVVLDLDYRGSSGYGREWRTGVYLHLGGPDLGDVLGGVDYLRSLGNIDPRRIGIWGVSYGGFMTNMALFLAPGVFRAGASWAAVNDWENYNAWYTGERLTTPQEHPEAYRRSSPIHFSGNLKDKLLVVHGMVDNNVLFQDAVQLTEKLIHEGKDFAHIFYPEESHGFVRDETLVDSFRRTAEWFDRHLRAQ